MKKLHRQFGRTARQFGKLFAKGRVPAPRRPRRMLTSELLEAREMLAADFATAALVQNTTNPADVNGDGRVSTRDALIVINQLIANARAATETAMTGDSMQTMTSFSTLAAGDAPEVFYDVNGDQKLSTRDAVMVINQLINPEAVQFALKITELDGATLKTTVNVGEEFLLRGYVKDLRIAGMGVSGAYWDVLYDNQLAAVNTNSLTYGPEYPLPLQIQNPSLFSTPGVLNDIGSDSFAFDLGTQEYLVWSIRVQATAPGVINFTGQPEGNPDLEILLIDDTIYDDITDPALIKFINTSITVLGFAANNDTATVGEDAGATTIDVLANDSLGGSGGVLQVTAVNNTGAIGVATLEGGVVKYNPNGKFHHLAAGATATDTFSYTLIDSMGNTDTATVTVTITGANDAPVIAGATFQVEEHAPGGTIVGAVVASDVDTPAGSLTYSIISGNTNDAFAIGPTGQILVANADALDFESQAQYTLSVRVSDGQGGQATATVTVNVQDRQLVRYFVEAFDSNGVLIPEGATINTGETFTLRVSVQDIRSAPQGVAAAYLDATYPSALISFVNGSNPLVFGPGFDLPPTAPELAAILATPGLFDEIGAADLGRLAAPGDTGKTLLFSVEFTANAAGDASFTTNPADQQPGVGVGIFDVPTELIDAADVIYGSTSFKIAVAAVFAANDDAYATNANATLVVSAPGVLGNDTLGPDGGAKALANADAVSLLGAVITASADGGFSYNPNNVAALKALGQGQTIVDQFQYDLLDGLGGSTTATVSITVTGVNDAPILASTPSDQSTDEDALYSRNLTEFFEDLDANDTLTYSARLVGGAALPSWLLINPTSGVLTGTPLNQHVGALEIEIQATDAHNASVTTTYTLTIENTNDAPTSIEIPAQGATEDTPFTFDGSAFFTDVDAGDVLAYTATLEGGGALPTWLSFDPATGVFSGMPANGDVGALSIEMTASDGQASASRVFSLTVVNVNDAPIVANPIADQQVDQDQAFNLVVPLDTFDDADAGDTLNYTAAQSDGSALPAWLTFNAETRTFSGTPGNSDVGEITVRVTAQDSAGAAVTDTFTLTVNNVNDAPTIADATLRVRPDSETGAVVGTVVASDIDAGDTLTYEITAGDPDGIFAIDADGQITVAQDDQLPLGSGPFELTVRVRDSGAPQLEATATITVLVTPNAPPVVANPIADQNATQDTAFSFAFAADTFSDPDVDDSLTYTARLQGGAALPSWLTFDAATRTFSGTPTNAEVGVLQIEVIATDEAFETASDVFTLTVANVNDAPTLVTPIADQSVNEDAAFALDIASHFADVDAGTTLSYTATLVGGAALPAWLSFNATTGAFSGTPTNGDVGVLNLVVTASDGALQVSDTFQLTVVNVNDAPVASDGTGTTNKNTPLTGGLQSLVADVDAGDTISFTPGSFTTAKGATVTINADGTFSYDPRTSTEAQALAFNQTLEDSFEFIARDAADATDTGVFNVTVTGLNPSSVAGTVYIDTNRDGQRQNGELLLGGVTIHLTGAGVNLTTTTDSNGAFKFANLAPGTYTLTQIQPLSMASAGATLGTQGGAVVNANTMTFTVGANQSVDTTGYHFREAGLPGQATPNWMFVSDAPTQGVYVAADPTTGAPLLTSQIGGWNGFTSIRPTLSADLSKVNIVAFDASGNEYRGTISTQDPTKFLWVHYRGTPRQFLIVGSSSQLVSLFNTTTTTATTMSFATLQQPSMLSAPSSTSSTSTAESASSTNFAPQTASPSTPNATAAPAPSAPAASDAPAATSSSNATSNDLSEDELWGLALSQEENDDDYLDAVDAAFAQDPLGN